MSDSKLFELDYVIDMYINNLEGQLFDNEDEYMAWAEGLAVAGNHSDTLEAGIRYGEIKGQIAAYQDVKAFIKTL